jgi:hypothetical protein
MYLLVFKADNGWKASADAFFPEAAESEANIEGL